MSRDFLPGPSFLMASKLTCARTYKRRSWLHKCALSPAMPGEVGLRLGEGAPEKGNGLPRRHSTALGNSVVFTLLDSPIKLFWFKLQILTLAKYLYVHTATFLLLRQRLCNNLFCISVLSKVFANCACNPQPVITNTKIIVIQRTD